MMEREGRNLLWSACIILIAMLIGNFIFKNGLVTFILLVIGFFVFKGLVDHFDKLNGGE